MFILFLNLSKFLVDSKLLLIKFALNSGYSEHKLKISEAKLLHILIAQFDINTDGTLEGTNEKFISDVLQNTNIPVIASGGIGSLSDLISLTKFENSGLYGVIVGKALYEEKFTIKEANNILSSERLMDFPIDNNHYA